MKGPRTLFGRLLLVFLLFGAVMMGALIYVLQVSHEQFHLEFDQTINRNLAEQYVAQNFLLAGRSLDAKNLHEGIDRLAAANPAIDVYLLDRQGTIIASSVPRTAWQRNRLDMDPIRAFLAGRTAPILGDDPRSLRAQTVFSAAPFHVKDCPGDYLYLALGRSDEAPGARKLRSAFAVREGLGVLFVATLTAVALSLLVLRLLTRRLSVLESTMSRFRALTAGELPIDTAVKRGDEIDRLDEMFRHLAAQLEAQMRALQEVDATRREMLANLSHDLRTPITTLLAHLESLQLNDPPLTEEERREFVAVAMRQGHRISRLVEQLLEAAKLEAGQVAINPETFPIGEVLQDVVQKFTLQARDKGLRLRVLVDPPEARVHADIALIERVFDNLIGNAIRHTPTGGEVVLEARREQRMVRLTVTDSGPGMSADEASRAFDRFYRGDTSRSTSAGQAGLGLAIVRSILALHGVSITLRTEPGRGACFSFDLPEKPA
jgi:signal transduction histidine kinase